jgi:hypothetical protein
MFSGVFFFPPSLTFLHEWELNSLWIPLAQAQIQSVCGFKWQMIGCSCRGLCEGWLHKQGNKPHLPRRWYQQFCTVPRPPPPQSTSQSLPSICMVTNGLWNLRGVRFTHNSVTQTRILSLHSDQSLYGVKSDPALPGPIDSFYLWRNWGSYSEGLLIRNSRTWRFHVTRMNLCSWRLLDSH